METRRERVAFAGIVHGTGGEARCVVRANKVTVAASPPISIVSDYTVDAVTEELPDGDYILEVNGEALLVRYKGGRWYASR